MVENKIVYSVESITRNLEQVLAKIALSAGQAGRNPQDVCLVVVTKTHPVEVVEALLTAGVNCIGESYIEEALPKIAALAGRSGVEWHMIGHVQSRKARQVIENFQFLHSLDSLKLANHLNKCAGESGKVLPVLLESNVSAEQSKSGWPAWDEAQWPELLSPIQQVLTLPNLEVRGLMTLAPLVDDPDQARPFFQRLRKLQSFLSHNFPHANWQELSMGMSADFEVAIQEGATMVRIGQAILGPRMAHES
jgi:pyridoxal phosphate enzyme (YggS family)